MERYDTRTYWHTHQIRAHTKGALLIFFYFYCCAANFVLLSDLLIKNYSTRIVLKLRHKITWSPRGAPTRHRGSACLVSACTFIGKSARISVGNYDETSKQMRASRALPNFFAYLHLSRVSLLRYCLSANRITNKVALLERDCQFEDRILWYWRIFIEQRVFVNDINFQMKMSSD